MFLCNILQKTVSRLQAPYSSDCQKDWSESPYKYKEYFYDYKVIHRKTDKDCPVNYREICSSGLYNTFCYRPAEDFAWEREFCRSATALTQSQMRFNLNTKMDLRSTAQRCPSAISVLKVKCVTSLALSYQHIRRFPKNSDSTHS